MMGTVPANRRGIAAGARMMLQNTGAVLSIAFVLAIVTAAVPKPTLFQIFSGLATGLSPGQARPVHREHAHGAVGARRHLAARRGVSLLRPRQKARPPRPPRRRRSRHERRARALRIGEVAELTGTTPRTIRYYEEIGPAAGGARARERAPPHLHRADVERLRELLRLQASCSASRSTSSRSCSRPRRRARRCAREFRSSDDPVRQREILDESLGHLDRQLELVRHRRDEIAKLEAELVARRGACARAGASSTAPRPPDELRPCRRPRRPLR